MGLTEIILGMSALILLLTIAPFICYPWSAVLLRRKGYQMIHALDGALGLVAVQLALTGRPSPSALVWPAIPTLIVCALLRPRKAPEPKPPSLEDIELEIHE